MKKIKNLFIALLTLITFNSFATPVTYTVTYNSTTNVTCNIGDTLKFYGTIPGFYAVSVNSSVVIAPHACNTLPYYIGYHVVVSGDNTFSINNTWNGAITVNVATGLNEKNASANIKLFPNPVVNVLQVSVINKANLMVYTPTGQAVITTVLEAGTNEVDVSKLASGIYYVKVGDVVSKLVKE
jgi:hypothetical protein